jgi:hypothetical protein
MLDQAAEKSHLFELDRLHLKQQLLMPAVDIVVGEILAGGVLQVDGVNVPGDEAPVAQINDAVRGLLGRHADFDLDHAGQLPQKEGGGDGEVIDPGLGRGEIIGDGVSRLYFLIGHQRR